MEAKEAIEGNRLIAEFMDRILLKPTRGYLRGKLHYKGGFPKTFEIDIKSAWGGSTYKVKHLFLPKDLKYHSSWEWLMPVVEKIEGLTVVNDNNETDYWFFKKGNHCVGFWLDTWGTPYQVKGIEDHTYRHDEALIQATWLAVVEFIKWYNLNKSK